MPVHSGPLSRERTQAYADRFLDEMRLDIKRARDAGADILPRLRCIHERTGHATPEYRTLVIPQPPRGVGLSPEVLSRAISLYAARLTPDRLVLALDAVQSDEGGVARTVMIAEARDLAGTRLFWVQPYHVHHGEISWDDPLTGGWVDPGEGEMILDAAFQPAG